MLRRGNHFTVPSGHAYLMQKDLKCLLQILNTESKDVFIFFLLQIMTYCRLDMVRDQLWEKINSVLPLLWKTYIDTNCLCPDARGRC